MLEAHFHDTLPAKTLYARLAELVLRNIVTEYPNHLQHLLLDSRSVATPRALHPTFYGCFDWHSSVHSHWMLVRLLRAWPAIPQRSMIEQALDEAFAPSKLVVEAAYLADPERRSFERPYGLAWALQLASELRLCGHRRSPIWYAAIQPLEGEAARILLQWTLALHHPVRTGTHQQTAFAWILLLHWARTCGHHTVYERICSTAMRCYGGDVGGPLEFEPSGEDFLSPCLMEADLMSRLLEPAAFAGWLGRFLPQIPIAPAMDWLAPVGVTDEHDGRAVHHHGLNLSRAWNLDRLTRALPRNDPRIDTLKAAARRHAEAGLDAVGNVTHYASTHWLPTFAVYLTTAQLGERE